MNFKTVLCIGSKISGARYIRMISDQVRAIGTSAYLYALALGRRDSSTLTKQIEQCYRRYIVSNPILFRRPYDCSIDHKVLQNSTLFYGNQIAFIC